MKLYASSFISKFLFGLVLFDLALATWAFVFPDLWFQLWHEADYVDPQALLKRCGANWAGFALMQFLAWRNWKKWNGWLLIVEGVRFSDLFTDIVCANMASSITLIGMVAFHLAGLINLVMGIYLIKAFRFVSEANDY